MSKTKKPLLSRDRIFYWAYGSNLCVRQMVRRCPRAVKFGRMDLKDCALVFRGVADVTLREGSVTPGGLWTITTECERALDQYEGVASRLYLKRYLRIKVDGDLHTCLFYQMRAKEGVLPPSQDYLRTIAEGYQDFNLPLEALDDFLQQAWGGKEVTGELAERWHRKGRPRLARSVDGSAEPTRPSPKLLPPPMWKEEGHE